MTATIVDDLVNWTIFAVILSDIVPSGPAAAASLPLSMLMVALVFIAILGVGRLIGPPALRWVRKHVAWPSGFIAVTTLAVLVVACVTERLGIHSFLGAFLVGAAFGGQSDEHQEAHDAITTFALSFFAPIYFVSMGMTTNFITNFDAAMVALVLAAALISKLSAVLLGARMAGMNLDRTAWAIAFGMNARGATGIILAGVGRTAGVIDDRIFVAIVVMALATSLLAGPMMNLLLAKQSSDDSRRSDNLPQHPQVKRAA